MRLRAGAHGHVTRKGLSRALLAFGLCFLLFVPAGCEGEAPILPPEILQRGPRPPNVILIVVDTMRADFVGPYGSPWGSTPTFERLAQEGVTFLRASTVLNATNASIASIFTGAYPWTHGLYTHMQDHLDRRIPTLAGELQRAGYQTAAIYSWVSLMPELSGLNRGFQHYEAAFVAVDADLIADGLSLRPDGDLFRGPAGERWVISDPKLMLDRYGPSEERLDGIAEVTTDVALAWAQRSARQPFFLWVHYQDPHHGYTPPSPFDGRQPDDEIGRRADYLLQARVEEDEERRLTPAEVRRIRELYAGEIRYTDQQVGRLLEGLRARGLLDNAIVVLTADHGEAFGEHGVWLHGLSVHEQEIRVPFIIWAPGRVPAGARVAAPVQNIDIMPTLLRALGRAVPAQVQGTDLARLWSGSAELKPAISASHDGRSVAVVEGDWKLIVTYPEGQRELYNLQADPDERINRIDQEPDREARLFTYIADWRPPWM